MARFRNLARLTRVPAHPGKPTRMKLSFSHWIFLLILLLAVTFVASLWIGEVREWNPTVILHIRLPRALLALVVGSALATAGAVYQGLLRNPLADPYILGTSSAGTFGALVAT